MRTRRAARRPAPSAMTASSAAVSRGARRPAQPFFGFAAASARSAGW